MTRSDLQRILAKAGYYKGAIDDDFGPASRAACIAYMESGPDYPLTDRDVALAANDLGIEPYKVWAVYKLESTGDPFINGLPTILPEPHRFSRSTQHRYDASHPKISSRKWNRKLYPGKQAARWDMLMAMVALDVDAGFMSASYGGFQLLGEQWEICDAPSPFAFAWRQSQSVADQLESFGMFLKKRGLVAKLRACKPGDKKSCTPFCEGYNGTAQAANNYDGRFAALLADLQPAPKTGK